MGGKAIGQKSVTTNVFFNLLFRVFNMIFPLFTVIYVSHILMANGIGKVSTAQNIVQYFVLLAPLGIVNYGTREIAKVRSSKALSEKLFTELFFINFVSTLLCTILYYVLIAIGDYFSSERLLYAVAGLPIALNVFNVEWYYQGYEEYKYIAIRSIVVKMVSLLAIMIFVKNPADYVVYAFIYTIGIAGNYILNMINLAKKGIHIRFKGINLTNHFFPIFFLLCSNIAIELYTLLDTTMLGLMCSDEIVGYYANSMKLVKVVVVLIAAIGGVLLPRLSYYSSHGLIDECSVLVSKVTKVMLFFAIPCCAGIFLLSAQIVWVMFGETFMPAANTVRIATVLILVLPFSNLYGTQILLTFNQEKKLLLSTCIGALANIMMNLLLIPKFQHTGATIASVISETLVTLCTIVFAKKYINIDISMRFLIKVIIASAIMVMPVYAITKHIGSELLCIVIATVIGAISYLLFSILVRNEIMVGMTAKLRKIINKKIG